MNTQNFTPFAHSVKISRWSVASVSLLGLALFSACGEDSTSESIARQAPGGMEVVSSIDELPACTRENEGEQVWVKLEGAARVCVDGRWFATTNSAYDNASLNCETMALSDGSGIKIICGGDSVGVVYSGSDGDAGLNGNDCKVKQGRDSSQFVITCGDMSTTINLVYSSSSGKESSSSEASSSSVSSSVIYPLCSLSNIKN